MKTKNNRDSDTQSILDAFRRIVRSLREAGKFAEKKTGLSSAQFFVLQKISESEYPLRVNDIAAKTLTHQSSVSVVVTKLVEKELVERLPSEKDARAVEVRLTKRGKQQLQTKLPVVQEQIIEGISRLTFDERNGLLIGLEALVKTLGLQDDEPSLFFEES
jgi:DNA-binding MarR family transcriptional regulator